MAVLWTAGEDWLRGGVAGVMAVVALPVLIYFLVINTSYLLLIGFAAWDLTHHRRRAEHSGHDETVASQLAPGVSVIVPAYNEEAGIVTSVQAMLALRTPARGGGRRRRQHGRHGRAAAGRLRPGVRRARAARGRAIARRWSTSWCLATGERDGVVRKENFGRSDAVNVGINAAAEPLVAMVDADSILDPTPSWGSRSRPWTTRSAPWRPAGRSGRPTAEVVNGRIVQVRMPGPGGPASRWSSTCARSCSAGPGGPASARSC